MSNQVLLEKDCLSCGAQIKISKIENPPTNSKKRWNKYNLDLTEHLCGGNRRGNTIEQPQPQVLIQKEPPSHAIADLAETIDSMREENRRLKALVELNRQDVRSLTAQIQLLRQELTPLVEKKEQQEGDEKKGGNGKKK